MARTFGTSEAIPGPAGLLTAVVAQATIDLESNNDEYRLDAEAFFAPGGGLDQWRVLLHRQPREDSDRATHAQDEPDGYA